MKRRSQAEVMKEREDECFSCGDGGQLVSCKKSGCPKVYHADCLNLTKRPAGQCSAQLGSAGVAVLALGLLGAAHDLAVYSQRLDI